MSRQFHPRHLAFCIHFQDMGKHYLNLETSIYYWISNQSIFFSPFKDPESLYNRGSFSASKLLWLSPTSAVPFILSGSLNSKMRAESCASHNVAIRKPGEVTELNIIPPAGVKGRRKSTNKSRPVVSSRIAATNGPIDIPMAPAATKKALARVICVNETHVDIIWRLSTSAEPNPQRKRPPIAIAIDR